jgi:hypothetical protein
MMIEDMKSAQRDVLITEHGYIAPNHHE